MALLKDEEGFRAEAYRDTGGVWTIGYGTTHVEGKPVNAGMTCTQAQAELWLHADLAATQTFLNQLRLTLTQNQFDALVSFVYNIGQGAFLKCQMLSLIRGGKLSESAKQFDRWNLDNGRVIPGLVARRRRERCLFES